MDAFTYTPFGFEESSEHSYFREALGDMRTSTFDLISLPPALDNKLGGKDYFDTVHTAIGETYKLVAPSSHVGIQQESTQPANSEYPAPESYELLLSSYSESSLSPNVSAATPDLTFAHDSPQCLVDKVDEGGRADRIEEPEALNQIIRRKRKTRASPEAFVEEEEVLNNGALTSPLVTFPRMAHSAKHDKEATGDSGPPAVKKRRGRQPKLHKTRADKDAAHAAFLERNRLAAHKCREKKRVGTAKQQKALSDVVNINAKLRAELADLKSETHALVQALLQHIGQPCAGGQTQAGLESAQETIWTADGTLLEMSLLRQEVGILVAPGELPLDPVQPNTYTQLSESGCESLEKKDRDAESVCSL